MHDQGLGVASNLETAIDFYRKACFHNGTTTVDGEGCLLYGERLIENRRELTISANSISADDPNFETIISGETRGYAIRASQTFQMGCTDNIPLACMANDNLFAQFSAGEYGFNTVDCLVRDNDNDLTKPNTCRHFWHHGNVATRSEIDEGRVMDAIVIWPDGDRTVTSNQSRIWRLNGNRTSGLQRGERFECLTNPLSNRQFCWAW